MALYISPDRAAAMAAAGQTNNVIISYENLFADGTPSTVFATEQADGAAINALTGTTYDYWSAARSGTTIDYWVEYASAVTLNFCAVAGHNFHLIPPTEIRFQYSINSGASFVDLGIDRVQPLDGSPVGFYFDDFTADTWRLRITAVPDPTPASVAVIWGGQVMTIPRRVYQGFSPILSPTEVELQSNVSVGGNLLGSSVIKRGSTINIAPQNLEPAFVRGTQMAEFIPSFNNGKPFFTAWRPTKYAADLHYCWRDGETLRPTNTGPRDLMGFNIDARVYEP